MGRKSVSERRTTIAKIADTTESSTVDRPSSDNWEKNKDALK